MSAHNPDDSSVSYDVVFSPSCHPLKFILIVTIPLVPQILTTLKTCTHLSFSCLVQSARFFVETQCILESIAESVHYEDPESRAYRNVTTIFTYLETNDNDPVNGVLSSSVGVNHMLEKYLFRKTDLEYVMTDLEYAVTDLEFSVDAHPFETNMKLQD